MMKTDHPCRTCSNKRNGVAKRGVKNPNLCRWKSKDQVKLGHEFLNSHGYMEVYVGAGGGEEYGRADKFVLKHKKVFQDRTGRRIRKGEVLHHIDGNKLNNEFENLHLCGGWGEHRDIHNSLEEVGLFLVRKGIVVFDRDTGEYTLTEEMWAKLNERPVRFSKSSGKPPKETM